MFDCEDLLQAFALPSKVVGTTTGFDSDAKIPGSPLEGYIRYAKVLGERPKTDRFTHVVAFQIM